MATKNGKKKNYKEALNQVNYIIIYLHLRPQKVFSMSRLQAEALKTHKAAPIGVILFLFYEPIGQHDYIKYCLDED